MASYPAPAELLPIFSPSAFDTNDIPLTIEEGADYFITYPTAQGAITIATLSTGALNVNRITPIYTTPSFTSADIGYIVTAAITYPNLTTNIIASNISANGTWLVSAYLSFTLLTTSPQLIVQDATPTTLGVVALKNTSATDRYIGSFIYTITAAANVVSLRLSLAPTTGGATGGTAGENANQYVRFVRLA